MDLSLERRDEGSELSTNLCLSSVDYFVGRAAAKGRRQSIRDFGRGAVRGVDHHLNDEPLEKGESRDPTPEFVWKERLGDTEGFGHVALGVGRNGIQERGRLPVVTPEALAVPKQAVGATDAEIRNELGWLSDWRQVLGGKKCVIRERCCFVRRDPSASPPYRTFDSFLVIPIKHRPS